VPVVQPDPGFAKAQTGASNNMRQQVAYPINVRIGRLGRDPPVLELSIRNFDYLCLFDNAGLTTVLEQDR
jgi:hypothetical protein